jgi:mono/diheme cytochrome c family protein
MRLTASVCGAVMIVVLVSAPAFAGQGAADKGAAVYAAQKCSMCHSVAGKGGKLALDGAAAHLNKLSAADITEWITKPAEAAKKHASTAKPPMRAYASLSKEDLDNLVAYMVSLKK